MTSAAAEERYLAKLESARADWWSSGNFDTWKRLYAGEYPRGFLIIDTLRKYAPEFRVEGASVLDVGCGDAGALIAFAEQGANAPASSASILHSSAENFARRSRRRSRSEERSRRVDSVSRCDLRSVMLDNVLEHVTDRPLTLREVKRVLKPGGLLYMVTPKPFSIYSLWNDPHYDLAGLVLMPRSMQIWYFEKIRGGGKGTYDVGVIPTRRKIRKLLDEAGFKITVSPREFWINYLRIACRARKRFAPASSERCPSTSRGDRGRSRTVSCAGSGM